MGLAFAAAVLLSAGVVYGTSRLTAQQQGAYAGTAGGYGYGPGMMGNAQYYSGGMMGGYSGAAVGRGMMGGYGWASGQAPGYSGSYPCPVWSGNANRP